MANNFTLKDLANTPAGKLNQHLFSVPGTGTAEKKKAKYNNQKVDVDGLTFDSKKEAKRFKELKLLLKAGHIGFLARQVEFQFNVEGVKVASYYADFCYRDAKTGEFIVEDVKSEVTRKLPVYRLKRKLMLSIHKIKIKEV